MSYKFILDPSCKKYKCPECYKNTFVRFLEVETGNLMPEHLGRCDRETNCGYFSKPESNKTLGRVKDVMVALPVVSYHDYRDLELTQSCVENNFLTYLRTIFKENEVQSLCDIYHIGFSNAKWSKATVFWQVDEDFRVRAGKVMLYNPDSGNRVKEPYSHISWMHTVMGLKNFNVSQCLFGLHHLNLDLQEGKIAHYIRVVESEKTAIIMCGLMPQFIWLATGSKSNFKESMLEPLKKHIVIAYPDKSEFRNWSQTANNLNAKGYNIRVSKLLETIMMEDGADLVDLLES